MTMFFSFISWKTYLHTHPHIQRQKLNKEMGEDYGDIIILDQTLMIDTLYGRGGLGLCMIIWSVVVMVRVVRVWDNLYIEYKGESVYILLVEA